MDELAQLVLDNAAARRRHQPTKERKRGRPKNPPPVKEPSLRGMKLYLCPTAKEILRRLKQS